MASNPPPRQRDVWFADLDPTRGHEQGGRRPVIAISVDELSAGPSGLAIVVPTTTVDRETPLHVRIEPPEGGIREVSFALPEMVRAIAHRRLSERWGTVRQSTLQAIVHRVHQLTHPGPR